MGSNPPPPPCRKDTWRPHIRRRRPPCPMGGVRTLIIGALRHIRHSEICMWRPSEGGIWPIKAQKSPDERPHPSPKHRDKHKCQGGSITVL